MKNRESKNIIKKCKAKHPLTNETICNREIWDNNEKLCIFHCNDKPVEEFKKYFLAELKLVNETDSIRFFDCQCFIFPQNINLKEVSFRKPVKFIYSKFCDNTDFSECQFSDETDFGKAKFGDKTNFRRSKFGNKTNFAETQFGNDSNFGLAKFGDQTNFWQTIFGNKTDFSEVQFGDETYFVRNKFGCQLGFTYARFNGELIFQDIKFENKSDNIINFTNIIFVKPEQVRFENIDLGAFAFVKSNIQKINFLDCEWFKFGNRHAVIDEIYHLNKKINNPDILAKTTLGEIEQTYLWLQFNSENNKRYPEAGDFYIGAMEMRRRQIANKNNIIIRFLRQNIFSLMAWYRYISFYGERYTRPLIWMAIVLFLFSVFYLIAGFDYPINTNPVNLQYEHINYDLFQKLDTLQFVKDFNTSFILSLCIVTFQKNVSFNLTTASLVLSIAETVLSAILVSLFLLALRRRFRR